MDYGEAPVSVDQKLEHNSAAAKLDYRDDDILTVSKQRGSDSRFQPVFDQNSSVRTPGGLLRIPLPPQKGNDEREVEGRKRIPPGGHTTQLW